MEIPENTSIALAAVQQKLLQHAYKLDPVPPVETGPESDTLAPGVFVERPEGVVECSNSPHGPDCIFPHLLLKKAKMPRMHSNFRQLRSPSNPSLVGFANLLSQLAYQLQGSKFDLTGTKTVISMGAGVASDRRILSKLLPSSKMVAVDPKYVNPESYAMAKNNLNENDSLFAGDAQAFSPQLNFYCQQDQPGFIFIRNISTHNNDNEANEREWGSFFNEAWRLLKEEKALAMIITASNRALISLTANLLQTANFTQIIIQHNKAALQTRWLVTGEEAPENRAVYATGPDSWCIVLTPENTDESPQ